MPVLAAVAAVLAFGLFSIVPTVTYLYVERRSRRHWIDAASSRKRAPMFVRGVAWWSLAIGQLGLPWLLVPATCGSVVFMLAKIGKATPSGTALLVTLGVAALAQAVFAFRLFPFAIRLLARDAKVKKSGAGFALSFGAVQLLALGAAAATFLLFPSSGFLTPVVRMALKWCAIVPVAAFAGVGLVVSAGAARASKVLD